MTRAERRERLSSVDIKVVIAHLQADVVHLVPELLPSGRREGAEWVVGSLDGEPGRSCAVHIQADSKAGVWSDFASGEAGDILELVSRVRFGGDRKAAFKWALDRYGLGGKNGGSKSGGGKSGGGKSGGGQPRAPQAGGGPRQDDVAPVPIQRDLKVEKRALAIFLKDCKPSIKGTMSDDYLQNRGIDLSVLGKQPGAIRHCDGLWCAEVGRRLPALVALVNGPAEGDRLGLTTLHRHYLAQLPSGRVVKADLKAPKKVFSSYKGGAIRVWKGASGKAFSKAPWGDTVILTEGLEDALTAAIARPDLRVLACVSLANMANQALPEGIRTVILAADNEGNEKAEAAAAKALAKAVARFQSEDRNVLMVRSAVGKDLNDRLLDKE
jgi:Toprim domain-containing protein